MANHVKEKLKRRGKEIYNKYFFNSNDIIEEIIKQYDSDKIIDNSVCDVIFDLDESYLPKAYDLVIYYPKKLKEIKLITKEVVDGIYLKYGETMEIMKENIVFNNVRGRISHSALQRSRIHGYKCNITSEDIVLIRNCPLLNIPLEYGNTKLTLYSPSIDRIDNSKGYVKDNIQIISMMANTMKGSATPEQLITFSENILKFYKKFF